MKKITVFTPTYNRAYILDRTYESLKIQTNKEFIWLIIDDGSKDNTEELVKNWINENIIEIKYIKQENSGKHIAHNTAVQNCTTEFFLILDSDDYLDEKAIEILNIDSGRIKDNEEISGIIGNRFYGEDKQVIGTLMPENIEYVTGIELYEKMKFKGDTLRLYKTKILKKFLFPRIEGEKFIYENVVFDPIDNEYKMLINRDRLYYCEYLDDGYTKGANTLKKKNPIGYSYALNTGVKYAITLEKKVKWTILYIVWCNENKISNSLQNFCNKPLYMMLYSLAVIWKKYERLKNDKRVNKKNKK